MTRRTGILLSLALVTVAGAVTTIHDNRSSDHPHAAYEADCLHRALLTRQALDDYQKSHDGAYPAMLDGLVPDQMTGIPYCPESRRPYSYCADGKRYLFYCEGARAAHDSGHIATYEVYTPGRKVVEQSGPPPVLEESR